MRQTNMRGKPEIIIKPPRHRDTEMKTKITKRMTVKLTSKPGGVIHTLESLKFGMAAQMKCGVVLAQWRDADKSGRACKRCAKLKK